VIPDPENDKPFTWRRLAGTKRESNEQDLNAPSPRSESREPGSKVKVDRLVQPWKQKSQIAPTDEGLQIHSSDEQNSQAERARVEIVESGSNDKFERRRQRSKQNREIMLTDEGIQID
jgi:hypothetical protein